MDNASFAFHVPIQLPSEAFLELGPPHVWWLFSDIKQSLEYFVRLTHIDGMDTQPRTLIMFDQAFECFTAIVCASQAPS